MMKILDCGGRLFTNPMPPRDLDGYVAEHLLKWFWTDVPVDRNGNDACKVLTPEKGMFPLSIELPPLGVVHKAFFVPRFSTEIYHATSLANKFGFYSFSFSSLKAVSEIQLAEMIVRAVIAQH
jgi:hypothetical protein